MTDFFLNFHSGWRYVVILATVVVALYFLYALLAKTTTAKQENLALRIWGGIVDVQATLGIVLLLIYLLDDRYYDSLTGHWITALIAVFMAHAPALYKRFNGEPTQQTRRIMGLVLPIITMILIVVALSAIDRSLFGS